MNCHFRQGRATPGRGRLLTTICAALAVSLVVTVGSASASMQRQNIGSFGPDGTSGTTFAQLGEAELDFHQAGQMLYVWNHGEQIHGWDVSVLGTQTPLGAPFPLEPAPGGYWGAIGVDNSALPSSGRLYFAGAESGLIKAFEPNGTELAAPFPISVGASQNICAVAVDSSGNIAVGTVNEATKNEGRGILRYNAAGEELAPISTISLPGYACHLAFDGNDDLYVNSPGWKYTAASGYAEPSLSEVPGGSDLAVDPTTNHVFVSHNRFISEYAEDGTLIRDFGANPEMGFPGYRGVAVDATTNLVYVTNAADASRKVEVFGVPVLTPTTTTNDAEEVFNTSAVLSGHIDPDGGPPVTDCYFQWGFNDNYVLGTLPCEQEVNPGNPITTPTAVSVPVENINTGQTYHFRLIATNENGTDVGVDKSFRADQPPTIVNDGAVEITSDTTQVRAQINPNTLSTTYYFELGEEDCSVSECTKYPQGSVGSGLGLQTVNQEATALTSGATYHFRVVATNSRGTTFGPNHKITMFTVDSNGVDPCPNAHVRKQTGASKIAHCRAYELVSVDDAGGYNVASDLIPGEEPLAAYPNADDRFLYTMSFGKLPGVAGFPVNLRTDPYVADRGADGWGTTYVGLPATAPSLDPFASTASAADSDLTAFAFGESDRCSPCFDDETTGIPLRLPNGQLVQGMQGSSAIANPQPAGEVRKHLSDDASHFVFGSEQKFEPAGNSNSVSIYDRNLINDTTQVVSTMPDGSTMTGDVAQLDISADGSRILVGKRVGTDSAGNDYFDLYLHVGNDPESVAIADTPNGVLYSGMSSDGSEVFFTTGDALGGDGDTSADLFRADVGASNATVSRVSTGTGGTGQGDGCTPTGNWNVVEGIADCGVVAIAGSGGVASGDGTAYFFSPELLDGPANGEAGEPNLYVARPGGIPDFVATLESDHPALAHGTVEAAERDAADLQVSENGDYAVFHSAMELEGAPTGGFSQIYRHDAVNGGVDCASCSPSGAVGSGDSTLSSKGRNLSEDGRVFFTTPDQLVLRDTNRQGDAYEWDEAEVELISSGLGGTDSGLASVDASGKNAYFFTRSTLAPQDKNGSTLKVYSARAGGGFPYLPPPEPCQAADECRGAGTEVPPPPAIGTYQGTGGNISEPETKAKPKRCRRGLVKRRGRCVKRKTGKRRKPGKGSARRG